MKLFYSFVPLGAVPEIQHGLKCMSILLSRYCPLAYGSYC